MSGDARTPLQVFTPGWRRLRDLRTPLRQNRSVIFQEVEPPLWCQADWEAGLGVGKRAERCVPGRGRHSQPERQTAAEVTQRVASVQRSRKIGCVARVRARRMGVWAPRPRTCRESVLCIQAALS